MANVTNAKSGAVSSSGSLAGPIYWAPIGTTLPTSTTDTLDAAFKSLGYVSEDGVTNDNSPESDKVKAWGGTTVMNMQTDRPDTFHATMLEHLNADLLKVIYGTSNVTTQSSGEIAVTVNADDMVHGSWVIDSILLDGKKDRIVIPDGVISELGTITRSDSNPISYELTITAIPDASGNYHYNYMK